MGMEQRCEQRQVYVVEAPMCGSSFPLFSKMLEEEKYQLAIRVVGWHQKLDEWYNLADFVFVTIYREWRKPCRKFYAGEGPALVDEPTVTPDMIAKWDKELCACVNLAFDYAWERTTNSWWTFRKDFCEMIGKIP